MGITLWQIGLNKLNKFSSHMHAMLAYFKTSSQNEQKWQEHFIINRFVDTESRI